MYTFLCDHLKMTPKDVDALLNKKSGLLGLSGKSDMREVIAAAAAGDPDASLARKVYVERIRKYIGAFLVKLNGDLDALVFTAGVGEGDRSFWQLATANLRTIGIEVDPEKIKAYDGEGGEIQSSRSHVKVMVVPTQEELSIAMQSLAVTGIADVSAAEADEAPDLGAMSADLDAVVTPRQFTFACNAIARSDKQRIILHDGENPKVVAAAARLLADDLAHVTIYGKPTVVHTIAKEVGVSLEGAAVSDVAASAQTGAASTEADAEIKFAGVGTKHAGARHAEVRTGSFVILLQSGGVKVLASYWGTSATTEEVAELAQEASATARSFGIAPRVALVGLDDNWGLTEAAELVKKNAPGTLAEGPLTYDIATCPEAAARAGVRGRVAGRASVCVFADRRHMDLCYKAAKQASGCVVVGPISMSHDRERPLVSAFLSASSAEDVVASVVATCVQSIVSKRGRR